ncbi:EamA family transporter [Francisella sp. 19X1-34]|uniref:EamA family transporter n=1 Tax=Francisella sp. 19X1-34 TaxID=3087177 RepID=UPI002E36384D|nr:EamA family transporter [Francisella sp. 19X1-34]MED7789660.1 EamA family transporter [Francisella sp. 19X1-34]
MGTFKTSPSYMLSALFICEALTALLYEKKVLTSLMIFIFLLITAEIFKELNFIGLLLPLIAGFMCFIYSKSSEVLSKKSKLNSLDILSIRFYLLLLLTFFLQIKDPIFLINIHSEDLLDLIILSAINLILPIYFAQFSIIKISAEKFAYIATLVPLLTVIMESFINHKIHLSLLIITFLIFISLNGIYKITYNRFILIFIKNISKNIKAFFSKLNNPYK